MEVARNRQRSGGTNLSTDPQYRLSRPIGSQSSQQSRNAFGGKIMGSSFSQTPKKPKKRASVATSSDHDYISSDDQLDSLSEYQDSPKKKKRKENEVYVDENGKHHDYHPDFPPDRANAYKNLKFKKKLQTDGSQRPAPETIEVVSDGNSNSRKDKGDKLVKKMKLAASSSSQDKKATRGRPLRDQNSTAIREMSSSPPRPPPRPRPRPTGPTKSSLAKQTDPAPRRSSRNGKPTDAASIDRDPSVEIVDEHAPRKPVAQPFPMTFSPVASPPTSVPASSLNLQPRPFPGLKLTPATSGSRPASRTTETRAAKPFPMAASSTSTVKKGKGKHRRVVTSDPESDEDDRIQAKAAPFPLAKTFDDPGGSEPPRTAGPSRPRRKPRKVYTELESDDDDDADEGIQGKVAPFPLGTQFFRDVGSPVTARHLKKRLSNGLDSDGDLSPRKRYKGDVSLSDDEPFDEESFFISSDTDPKTLCPYCDNPLPPSPSPILTKMLEAMIKKSFRDPRPANPLGRKAPFATFIDLCHRHQFESDILPEAEEKGWPKAIDWDSLSARIEQMQSELQKLIDDTSEKGPRSRSTFWQDIMKAIKAKGLRAATGVQEQFENFEKTQPGYYGELGSVIIHQTLYDLFPPASIDTEAIAPLGAEEFLQRVLIPEVALRLIMEDRQLKGGSGRQTALQVLRESSSYGVAMFPADGTEPTGGGGKRSKQNPEGLTAGETIIMERARRRRKEIEEEDAREEAAAEAERARMMQVDKVQPKAKPRPRPRQVSRGSSKSSMMDVSKTDDENLFTADEDHGRPQHPDTDPIEPIDYGADHSESDSADSEIVVLSQLELQPSRRSRSPPAVRDGGKLRRSTRSRAGSVKPSRRNGSSPISGGWNTNYDSESKGKSAANVARNRRRRQETRRDDSDGGSSDSEVPSIVEVDPDEEATVSNTKTPKPRRKNPLARKPLPVEDEATPRPSRSIAPASSQAELPPLLKAKALAEARKKAAAAAAAKDPETDNDDEEKGKGRSVPMNSPQAQGWVHSMRADYLGKDKKSGEEDSSDDEEDPPQGKDKSHSWLLSDPPSNNSTPRHPRKSRVL